MGQMPYGEKRPLVHVATGEPELQSSSARFVTTGCFGMLDQRSRCLLRGDNARMNTTLPG